MVPNRFHFVFGLKRQIQPFHLVHYLCLASCLRVNSPDAVYFYYHYEPYGRYWDLIKDQLLLVRVPRVSFIDHYPYRDRFTRHYKYAHASDFIRLEKLISHGGVYADMDTLFVNPIPQELRAESFVLGREDDIWDAKAKQFRPSICNAFMLSERNSKFGNLWVERQHEAFNGAWTSHSTLLPRALANQYPDLVHLEPSRTFYKHMWTPQGIEMLLRGLDTENEGVVSFHLWAHLWWDRWRRGFSTFHGGMMTESYVRNIDTTYNVVARQFLPPPATRFWQVSLSPVIRPVRTAADAAVELGTKAYILTKLAAFSVVKEDVFPRAAEHLDYAKRQWKHPYLRTGFRARTAQEKHILDNVTLWDEYGMEAYRFAPDDVVLDIGAHIGTFSYMCYRQGSRRIHAFEAEAKNFERLARFVGTLDGVIPYHLAVFRSDENTDEPLHHSGYLKENTGAGNLLFRGTHISYDTQQVVNAPRIKQQTSVIPLDEILVKFSRVRLLKLDCEMSEFPILLTSRLLDRVDEMIGEYHQMGSELYAKLDPRAQVRGFTEFLAQDLLAYLESEGFTVQLKSTHPFIGKFYAKRETRKAVAV